MTETSDLDYSSQLTRRERRRTLMLITVLHGFTHFYMCALLPLYLLIKQDLHLTSLAPVTLLVTVQSLFYCLTSLPLGMLADRMSRKRLLGIGLLMNGMAFVAVAAAPNYGAVVCGLMCAGIAGGFYHPAATALVFALFPESKGKAVGVVGMGAALGFFLGPLYAGWRGQHAGWREACVEMGIAGVLTALLFMRWAQDAPDGPEKTNQNSGNSQAVRSILIAFIWVGLGFSLRDFGGAGLSTLSSLFLQKVHHFGGAHTGFILGLMSLPAIVANPLFGALSEGRREPSSVRRLVWLTALLIVSGLAAMAIPYLPRAGVAVGLLIFQFFLLATYPVMESAFADVIPDALRGRVYGVYLATVGVVGSAAPWIMGEVTDRQRQSATAPAAYVPAYTLLGVLIILGTSGVTMMRRVRRHPAVAALGAADCEY